MDQEGLFNYLMGASSPLGAVLNARLEAILSFMRERVTYTYIPSVRTADQSTRVVQRILSEELSVIEDDERYHDALRAISRWCGDQRLPSLALDSGIPAGMTTATTVVPAGMPGPRPGMVGSRTRLLLQVVSALLSLHWIPASRPE